MITISKLRPRISACWYTMSFVYNSNLLVLMNWLNYAYKYAHTSMRIKWTLATANMNAPLTFNIHHKHNVRSTIKHWPRSPSLVTSQ